MTDLSRYSILQNVSPRDIRRDPFPHIVIDPCLPHELYAELSGAYPTDEVILGIGEDRTSRRTRPNSRHDVGAHQILSRPEKFSEGWRDFAAYHTSPQFFAEVIALFGSDIRATYPALDDRLGQAMEAWTPGVRYAPGWRDHHVALDCHIGINTPTVRASSVRRIHTDAPDELFAALFYFRQVEDLASGGDFEIFRWKPGRDRLFVGSEIDEIDAEHVITIPYRPNTAVLFLNSDQSLHAVSRRDPSPVSRRLVNVMGRVPHSIPEGLFSKRQKPGVVAAARRVLLRYRAATDRF